MKTFLYSLAVFIFTFAALYSSTSRNHRFEDNPALEAELDNIYYSLEHLNPKDIYLQNDNKLYIGSDKTNYIVFSSTGMDFYINDTLEGYIDSTGFVSL